MLNYEQQGKEVKWNRGSSLPKTTTTSKSQHQAEDRATQNLVISCCLLIIPTEEKALEIPSRIGICNLGFVNLFVRPVKLDEENTPLFLLTPNYNQYLILNTDRETHVVNNMVTYTVEIKYFKIITVCRYLEKFFQIAAIRPIIRSYNKILIKSWKDGSVVKNSNSSYRGPVFRFQYPLQEAHNLV